MMLFLMMILDIFSIVDKLQIIGVEVQMKLI